MEKNNKVFCVISHTHWDREWYQPLENFRQRLADLFDRLLIIIDENPDYIFHMDAQTVVLEDYLAMRPEKKAIIMEYVKKRRIIIGPWYLANDFYLTSGEATIRNLIEGQKISKDFGGFSKAGYSADQFGTPSQLPQILRGFGIDNYIFGRGFARYSKIDEEGNPVPEKTPTEFIWKGADGTEVLAIHMRHWYNNAQRFSADIDKAHKYLKTIESWYDNEFTLTPYLLLMNGVDHLEAQPDIIQVAEGVQKKLPEGQYFLQYNIDDYVKDVQNYLDEHNIKPEVVEGELRFSPDINQLHGTLSSRHYLKVANTEAQALMENRLEPLYSMMEKNGMHGEYPHDRLIYVWKNIIRNHPHDSICGCSHDGVHKHMENRYEEIAEYSVEQLRRGMNDASDHTAARRNGKENEYVITVANTLGFPVCGSVKVTCNMLRADDMEDFRIVDSEGNDVNFRVISKKEETLYVTSPVNLPGGVEVWTYEMYVDAGTVNAFAFKTFTIVKGNKIVEVAKEESTTKELNNGILKLTVTDDGKVDITNIKSGRVLKDCFRAEDCGDIGNSYTGVPSADAPILSDNFAKKIEFTENNEYRQAVTIEYALDLPVKYNWETAKSSEEKVVSTLKVEFELLKHESFVRINYEIDNHSKDHRLRLEFDADISREESFADIPFDVVSHTNKDFYPRPATYTHPNATFAAIQDGNKGLAVFTAGAHEYEHADGNHLLLTILRATGRMSGSGPREDATLKENQCLRRISGRMAVCPFEGNIIDADIINKSLNFRMPLTAICTAVDTKKFAGGRPFVQDTELTEYFYLPDLYPEVGIKDNESAIKIEGKGIIISAFKCAEDEGGLIVRFVNYNEHDAVAHVVSKGKIFRTNMDEISKTLLGRDELDINMKAKEIITLYIDR